MRPNNLSQSSNSNNKLRRLAPITLQPARISERGQLLLELKKIDTIEVQQLDKKDEDGQRLYAINVYMKQSTSENRIPATRVLTTNDSNPIATTDQHPSGNNNRPSVCVKRTLGDVEGFRSRLYGVVHAAHHSTPCNFCSEMIPFSLWGHQQPSPLVRWLVKDDKITESLAKFLNELVQLTLTCTSMEGPRCQGQEGVPALTGTFLLEQDMTET